MAAIFQIRRGNSSYTSSLVAGELYLDQTSQNLIVGVTDSSKQITLLKLNDINTGSLHLTGDIRLSGSIYLGDSVGTDNISALGVFTTHLVPNGTIDLGTTTAKWNNVYGNAIYGAISASNGVISGSAQFTSVLSSLNDFTASQNTKNSTLGLYTASVDAKFTTLQSLTSSNLNRLSRLEESTSSLNQFSASQNTKDSTLQAYTASIDTKLSTLQTLTASTAAQISRLQESTASLNTFSASASNRLSRIEESTSSLNAFSASENTKSETLRLYTASVDTKWLTLQNVTSSILSYTQSLRDAITVSGVDAASTTTIKGNLYVQGTQTVVDSTTLNIADNVITLNAAGTNDGGLVVRDSTGVSTTSGSLLWDVTNDYWKIGKLNSESQILTVGGMGVVSGSLLSLNTFSASTLGHIADINIKTGSFETKFSTLGLYTASLDNKNSTLQTLTASIAAQISRLQESTASLNLYTSSQDNKNSTLQTLTASMAAQVARLQESTASLNLYTSSNDTTNTTQNTRLSRLEESTSSLNAFSASENTKSETLRLYTASVDTKFSTLALYTASIDTKFTTLQTLTASVQSQISRLQESTASLNTFSASMNAFYNQFTASAVGFSASIDDRVDKLEYTASYGSAAVIAGQFGALQTTTASLMLATGSLQLFTASQEAKNIIIGNYTSSMNTFTASINGHVSDINTWSASVKGHIVDINTKTGSLETTNTTQNTRLSRIEESTASLNLFTQSISTAYEGRATATKTIFSGSSQVSYVQLSNIPSGIISSSAQIDTLFNIDGIVSGSSQINFTQIAGISPNIISSSSDTSNVDMIITGGSISANLYGGVVSGSSQLVGILTSLNEFSASENSKSATLATFTSSLATTYEGRASASKTIFSGSSQVNFTQLSGISNGIVSSSAQITPLLPSGVLSGSNQTNITSINQNLGTSTTGVQFASLGIGTAPDATYELKIQGDVAASGDIVAYYTSDKKLKDNIQPIQNALDKVNKLGGYTFDWNEELQKARKGHDIGVIAQEVQSVLPEVVVERDNGYLGVDYQKLVPVLIEAIKELSAKVKELENK
jgi:hypothetical protein